MNTQMSAAIQPSALEPKANARMAVTIVTARAMSLLRCQRLDSAVWAADGWFLRQNKADLDCV
jgi:hypothetical protein